MIYEFENCILDTATQELRRAGEVVEVQPQVFAVLAHLLANPGRVVSKIELLDEVWGDRFVSEAALTSRIKLARQACGDSGRVQRIIKTVHGRGYRMVATITERGGAPVVPLAPIGPGVVGRDDEIDRLCRAATAAGGGAPTTIFVTGPAGAGKSTLVAELLERMEDLDRWLVLRGRCHRSRSGAEPYFALLDALGSVTTSEPDLLRDTLDRVAPSWLVQLPVLVDDDGAQRLERRLLGGARQRMLREGADAFASLARRRPTLLLLEDLHQADGCTLDVLELLSSQRDAVPLLIIATATPGDDQVDSLISELGADGSAAEVSVGPLDREAIGTLLADRREGASLDPVLTELVHSRSGGNPLFAQEILGAWEANGVVRFSNGVLVSAADLDELAATLPASLARLLGRSLDALDPDELGVLQAAAAAGLGFDGASVAAGLGRPVAEVEVVLASLARRSVEIEATGATRWPDGTVSTTFRFLHELHRDAIHERTPLARRAELHGRIGLALEAGFRGAIAPVTGTIADHFLAAGDAARAGRYLRRVASQAIARQAHGHAERVLEQALGQCERLPLGDERDAIELEVRLAQGQARVGTAGWLDTDATRHYERALALAAQLGATDEEAQARYALATVSEMNGDFERTEDLLVPVLVDDEDELDIEAYELVACSTFHRGAFARSQQHAEAALAMGAVDEPSVPMAQVAEHPATSCNSWLSLTNWFLGRSDDSLRRAENAVRLGERHRYALGMALHQRTMLHQLRAEPAECRAWADRTLALERQHLSGARRLQTGVLRHWAVAVSVGSDPQTGDGTAAAMREGVQRVCDASVWLDPPYYLALLADVLLHTGEAEGALAAIEDAAERIDDELRTYFHRSELHRLWAQALLGLGSDGAVDQARDQLDTSLSLAEAMGSPVLALRTTCDRVELELERSDPAPWIQRLTALVTRFDHQAPPPDVLRGRALLDALS